jgi:hypothetical protein
MVWARSERDMGSRWTAQWAEANADGGLMQTPCGSGTVVEFCNF